jgi:hypothetical protein
VEARASGRKVSLGEHGIADVSVAADKPSTIQAELRLARKDPGHALCHCHEPPRKLQIRQRAGSLHLAVWPEDGNEHAADCPFHRVHVYSEEEASSVAFSEQEDGFQVELRKRLLSPWHPSQSNGDQADPAEAQKGARSKRAAGLAVKQSFDLGGLLELLWRRADFDRWLPGWKRDYWLLAKRLSKVIAEGNASGRPLAELIQVVPPWREHQKAEIQATWEAFDRSLDSEPSATGRPTRILVGEVEGIRRSKFGWELRLKHTRPKIYLNEATHTKWIKHWTAPVMLLGSEERAGSANHPAAWMRVVAALQVIRSSGGNHLVVDGELLVLDANYMACKNAHEAALVQRLIDEGRAFRRRSHEEEAHDRAANLPTGAFELLDTTIPVTLAVVLQLKPEHRKHVEDAADAGSVWWVWSPEAELEQPKLPDADLVRHGAREKAGDSHG